VLTLVLGGARSGKSRYAQSLIGPRQAVYVATARHNSRDLDMEARITRHRADRPATWTTIEEPEHVPAAVLAARPVDAPVIVECATLWLANLMGRESETPPATQEEILLGAMRELATTGALREVIVVSNEVGAGVHPVSAVGRRFQDLQGWANQILASAASTVVLVVAGVPLTIKDGPAPSAPLRVPPLGP
jgi:adenosylcobinamide kinase / adenosylcobinamide-phosphate guanylyltransferase